LQAVGRGESASDGTPLAQLLQEPLPMQHGPPRPPPGGEPPVEYITDDTTGELYVVDNLKPTEAEVSANDFAERVGMVLHLVFGRLCNGQLKGGGRLKILENVARTSFLRKMSNAAKTFADAAQTEVNLVAAAADDIEGAA
jgi:hypothetical protein